MSKMGYIAGIGYVVIIVAVAIAGIYFSIEEEYHLESGVVCQDYFSSYGNVRFDDCTDGRVHINEAYKVVAKE